MSIRIETYIILGVKLDERFTEMYWKSGLYDEEKLEWDKTKQKDKPYFITDGMNGDYTFFGIVQQLSNGSYDHDDKIVEISVSSDKTTVVNNFNQLPFDHKITEDDVKLYYLPHYV